MNDADLDAFIILDARALGVTLSEAERARILSFTRLLEKWNRKIRLAGPSDVLVLLREQVLDALAFIPFCREADAWWDIGSGGGLPALVLACLEPERRFALVEPVGKKAAFLVHASQALSLTNVAIHHGRLEPGGRVPDLRDGFGPAPRAAMSRATFAPERWYELAAPLAGQGGLVLIAAAERPSAFLRSRTIRREEAYTLPATGAQRYLGLVEVP